MTSAQAGAALASGWAGADVRVLPVGDSGRGFLTAYADLLGAEVEIAVEDGYAVTSARADGDVVLQVSAPTAGTACRSRRPRDRSGGAGPGPGPAAGPGAARSRGLRVHDGGAGMLAGLGDGRTSRSIRASSRWPVTEVDLAAARAALGDTELIGVVPADQTGQHLLGPAGDHLAPRSRGGA